VSDPLPTATEDDVLPGDALAEAPTEAGDTVTDPAAEGDTDAIAPAMATEPEVEATPVEAYAVVEVDDAATMLSRIRFSDDDVAAVFDACSQHNAGFDHARSVDPLLLGLLWQIEGARTRNVRLDPNDASHRFDAALEHLDWIRDPAKGGTHGSAWQADAERAWRLTWIGIWGFGLDSVFGSSATTFEALYDWTTAVARWEQNMSAIGWSKAALPTGVDTLPFRKTDPGQQDDHGVQVLSLTQSQLITYLLVVAIRFSQELWNLPEALVDAGLASEYVHPVALASSDPLLAYLTYNAQASRAAGLYEAVAFLRDICTPMVAVTGGSTSAETGTAIPSADSLDTLIQAMAKWKDRLVDDSTRGFQYALKQVVSSSVLRYSTRERLFDLAGDASINWQSTTREADLASAVQTELNGIAGEWRSFGILFAPYAATTSGQYLYEGANRNASPQLVPNSFGTFGYSVVNFVGYTTDEGCSDAEKQAGTCPQYRFLTAAGRFPW